VNAVNDMEWEAQRTRAGLRSAGTSPPRVASQHSFLRMTAKVSTIELLESGLVAVMVKLVVVLS